MTCCTARTTPPSRSRPNGTYRIRAAIPTCSAKASTIVRLLMDLRSFDSSQAMRSSSTMPPRPVRVCVESSAVKGVRFIFLARRIVGWNKEAEKKICPPCQFIAPWLILRGLLHKVAFAEELDACEEGVVAFECHQADEYQDGDRRREDRELQREPFPVHVHEDGDDETRLQEHEDQDQRPAQRTL